MYRPRALRGGRAVTVSAIGFGVCTALSVVALRTLHPADLLAVELVGSTIMLVAAGLATGRMHRRGSLRALAQGVASPGLTFQLCNIGLARTTATSGSLLLGAETLMTVLLAIAVLGERIGRTGAAALALGMAGTALVAFDGGRHSSDGAANAPATVACALGARVAFNVGIGGITAARAGMPLSPQPVAGTLIAVGFLGETVGLGQAVGGVLIVAGVPVISRDRPVTVGDDCESARWIYRNPSAASTIDRELTI